MSPAPDRSQCQLTTSLDDVANSLKSQLNTQNEAGFDLNGNAGTVLVQVIQVP